ALWLRCQNPQIQPVLAEPGALPEHKIAASTAQVIYQQSLRGAPNRRLHAVNMVDIIIACVRYDRKKNQNNA
ncbi:MAG: hypothetical protein LBS10_09730, partial [Gracilibacteraceae bacterium]|nr:hypothetical protein [Gracilibacteraceae bacterium]